MSCSRSCSWSSPVKVVVFSNSSLAFVDLEMKAAGLVNYGTALTNPSFADIATAMGLHASRVERPDELTGALERALAHPGPALVEVMTAGQELAMPPTVTLAQAKGFALYSTRTVLSGRGDELIDLADVNLRRRFFS